MDPGYTVVRARVKDIPAIPAIEIAAAALLRGHAPDAVLSEVTDVATLGEARKRGHVWVALAGDIPVGYASVRMLAEDLPHLQEIDVLPSHGRRGVGTALVHRVCRWARSAGYAHLTLTTFRNLAWNMPFYAGVGFHEIPSGDLRPELAAIVTDEIGRGMSPEMRVVMQRRLA